MSLDQLYHQTIKPLAMVDRLQLARMILNDIPDESVVDYCGSWSDEDLRDFSQAVWQAAVPESGEMDD